MTTPTTTERWAHTFTVTGRVADASAGRVVRERVLALLRELGATDVQLNLKTDVQLNLKQELEGP
ncbi:MAG: hypothetical protein E6J75_11865 [Deltaproteobacteria bacterium]|nr:MAG: hypothetical protein E6J75_11865 [Deltaproteobacteria bacterium]